MGKLSLWKSVWWIKPQIFLTDPLQKKLNQIFATFSYISFTPERLKVCFFSGLSYCCPHFRNNFVLNWVCPLNGCGPLGGRWVPRWRWKGGSGVGGGGHGTPCHLPPLPSKTHLAISHIVNYHPSLQKPTFIFTSLPPWQCQLQPPSLTSNTPTPSLPGVTHLYPGHNINNTCIQSFRDTLLQVQAHEKQHICSPIILSATHYHCERPSYSKVFPTTPSKLIFPPQSWTKKTWEWSDVFLIPTLHVHSTISRKHLS